MIPKNEIRTGRGREGITWDSHSTKTISNSYSSALPLGWRGDRETGSRRAECLN
jgi:hypothetical protein